MAEADRLRAQYEEAERLVRDAQRAAEGAASAGPGDVPPRGWSVPGGDRHAAFGDLSQIAALLESARGVVPPELTRQLAEALRELLIAVRAVLDWYIARLEPGEPPAREAQDIPVD